MEKEREVPIRQGSASPTDRRPRRRPHPARRGGSLRGTADLPDIVTGAVKETA